MVKRLIDILVSLLGILVLGLPMLVMAAAVRMESRGGAIFRQRRAGWRGKPFTMLKFRTMRADVEPYGGSPHSPGDPRLTRVGRFLRETSLDELPQLFNVLAGQMSLVGPRPLYDRQAARWNERQRRRLEVRPGLTGHAQAYGRAGLTIEEKIDLDVYYVDHRGIWLDARIIFRTIVNVLARRGEVYERQYSSDAAAEDEAASKRDDRGG